VVAALLAGCEGELLDPMPHPEQARLSRAPLASSTRAGVRRLPPLLFRSRTRSVLADLRASDRAIEDFCRFTDGRRWEQ
jgi:hypothetical protein